jgi:hypothetical protein
MIKIGCFTESVYHKKAIIKPLIQDPLEKLQITVHILVYPLPTLEIKDFCPV